MSETKISGAETRDGIQFLCGESGRVLIVCRKGDDEIVFEPSLEDYRRLRNRMQSVYAEAVKKGLE